MTVSVKLEACELAECANVASKPGDRAGDIDNVETATKQIEDSQLPQSFVESIPKLDAIVSAIDQVADVSLCIFSESAMT